MASQDILDEKDSTISKLKENLMCATTDRLDNASPDEKNHVEIDRLIQDIDRRDEIIAELQAKLLEAVVEINESSQLIEKFKSDDKMFVSLLSNINRASVHSIKYDFNILEKILRNEQVKLKGR